jgi:stress response protein SCP2
MPALFAQIDHYKIESRCHLSVFSRRGERRPAQKNSKILKTAEAGLGDENARYRKNMRRSLNFDFSIKMFDERRKWEDKFFRGFREAYMGKKL